MPFNGNGVWSAPSSPGAFNPAISGQDAGPTAWNTLLADIAAAFDLQICRDGQSTVSDDIPFNDKKITGLGDGVSGTDAVNLAQVEALIAAAVASVTVPAGTISGCGTAAAPTGYLLCDGASYVRTDYAALFSAIGTAFGSADGTHFNVPDLRGRVPAGKDNMGGSAASRLTSTTMTPDGNTLAATGGAQTITLDTTMIPAHSHGVTDPGHTHSIPSQAAVAQAGGLSAIPSSSTASGSATTGITINNTGGGLAHGTCSPA
jgi:microcystin-dependent protein